MESLRFLPQVWNNWGSKSETLTKGKMWRHGQGRAPQLTQGQGGQVHLGDTEASGLPAVRSAGQTSAGNSGSPLP